MASVLYADLNSGLTVDQDILAQGLFLSIFEFHYSRLGRASVDFDEFMRGYELCRGVVLPSLSIEDVRLRMDHMNRALQTRIFIESEGGEIRIQPFELDWQGSLGLVQMHRNAASSLEAHYAREIPTHLLDELDRLKSQLLETRSQSRSKFAITCGILSRGEIQDTLDQLIGRSEKRLYLMIAFYEASAGILASYVAERVLRKGLDFKVMYRPRDAENSKLILALKDKLEPEGIRDFYRAYDAQYLNKAYVRVQGRVGNLHSKLVMSENEMMIGSANLTSLALNSNLETAIHTTDQTLVSQARRLFNDVWKAFDAPRIIE